jgi:hypothetical protein
VALRVSRCQLGIVRVPPVGAVVVVLEWRTPSGAPSRPLPARLRPGDIRLRPGAIGCQPPAVRGGSAQIVIGVRRVGVYVMVGERAGPRTRRRALAVAASLRATQAASRS